MSLPKVGTISEHLQFMDLVCTHPECGQEMPFSQAQVPDIINLYLGARRGPVEKRYPLTARELADDVRCDRHPLRTADGVRMQMFCLWETASLMDRRARENLRIINTRVAREDRLARAPRRSAGHSPPQRGGFVNATLPREPKVEKPRPKYRKRARKPKVPRNPNAPKRFGDERAKTPPPTTDKKGKKKGKGKNEQKNKNPAR